MCAKVICRLKKFYWLIVNYNYGDEQLSFSIYIVALLNLESQAY